MHVTKQQSHGNANKDVLTEYSVTEVFAYEKNGISLDGSVINESFERKRIVKVVIKELSTTTFKTL